MKYSPIFLLYLISASRVGAQSSGEGSEATLRKLLARVESLEGEVRQLRAEKSRGAAGAGKEIAPLTESAEAAMDTAGRALLRS